jgi:aspartate 1-decarboxylase
LIRQKYSSLKSYNSTVIKQVLSVNGICNVSRKVLIIIMCYAHYDSEEAKEHKPKVVFVDDENKISRVTNYEKHGLLKDQEK